MRRFLMAIALTCALSGAALAGEMPTCGIAPPAPDETADIAVPGEMPTTGYASPGDMPTGGLSIVLTILDLVF